MLPALRELLPCGALAGALTAPDAGLAREAAAGFDCAAGALRAFKVARPCFEKHKALLTPPAVQPSSLTAPPVSWDTSNMERDNLRRLDGLVIEAESLFRDPLSRRLKRLPDAQRHALRKQLVRVLDEAAGLIASIDEELRRELGAERLRSEV